MIACFSENKIIAYVEDRKVLSLEILSEKKNKIKETEGRGGGDEKQTLEKAFTK